MIFQTQVLALVACLQGILHVTLGQGSDSAQCSTKAEACIAPYTTAAQQGFGTIIPLMELCGSYQSMVDCLTALNGDTNCMLMVNSMKANIVDVYQRSKMCDKKDEAMKYRDCFSKPGIDTGCSVKGSTCESLVNTVNCFSNNAKSQCGQAQSDIMRFVANILAGNIAKNVGATCPELENTTSTGEKIVPASMVLVGLLSALMGVLVLN